MSGGAGRDGQHPNVAIEPGALGGTTEPFGQRWSEVWGGAGVTASRRRAQGMSLLLVS